MEKILDFSFKFSILLILVLSFNSIIVPVLVIESSGPNTIFKDTLFRKSHDFYYDSWVQTDPLLLLMPKGTFQFTNSSFTNINITQNTFPQNEPSVKISRKNPNNIVAAWRDFRTGVDPAVRRIGFSHSTDGGVTWSPGTLLPSLDLLHPRASDPAVCTDTAGNFYISEIAIDTISPHNYRTAVFKSTDGGISFNFSVNIAPLPDSILSNDDKEYITSDMVPNSPYKNNIYVVWNRSPENPNILVRSTNSGLNWSQPVNFPLLGGGGFVPAVGLGGIVYIIGGGQDTNVQAGIYIDKSTDGGLSFGQPVLIDHIPIQGFLLRLPSIATDISNGPRGGYVYAVWSCPINYDPQNVDEDIFFSYSSNAGATWSARKRVNNDPENNGKKQYFPWMTCNEQGNIYITFYDCRSTPDNTIFEAYLASSTDGGLTFRNDVIGSQQSPSNYPNQDVRFGDYIGIDSWGGKVIPVWTDERAGNFDMEIYTASIPDTVIGIKPISDKIPRSFKLYQNYPNPFNPSTMIRFDIASANNVSIVVYDILGREIAKLVNENLKPGSYETQWNASGLATGVYFYRLTAGDFTTIKKMVVLK